MKISLEESVPVEKSFLQRDKMPTKMSTTAIDGELLVVLFNEDTYMYDVVGLESDHCYFSAKSNHQAENYIAKKQK